jgi:hypothetical protein
MSKKVPGFMARLLLFGYDFRLYFLLKKDQENNYKLNPNLLSAQ